MRFFSPLSPLLKGWLISFLGWGLVASLLSAQLVTQAGIPWTDTIMPGVRDWLPWAVLTPLLFRLASRLPLDRQHWKTAVPIHLGCCIAALTFMQFWRQSILPQRPPGPPSARAQVALRDTSDWKPGPDRRSGGPNRPPPGFFLLFQLLSSQLPIYLMITSGAHAALFYRRSQERAASLARARLDSLRMQLQPHFLFNALNTIAGLVHSAPDKADAMLISLSDLLRLSLETSSEVELPLHREMEMVERYLAIMHARFEERLQFRFDIEVGARSALVPGFILQPLVENAVRHGLEPRAEGGVLEIRARRDQNHLKITIADNGIGVENRASMREGVGLTNTRARLHELYGKRGIVELTGTHGFTVQLTLPFRTAA